MYVAIQEFAVDTCPKSDQKLTAETFLLENTAFLLTHSRPFQIAMALAFTEYFIEWYFFPGLKGNYWIYIPAFIVAVLGQTIRTTAMYTGGVSFHHMVQVRLFDLCSLITCLRSLQGANQDAGLTRSCFSFVDRAGPKSR